MNRMKASELVKELGLKIKAGEAGLGREVDGCYIGDLMSLAMAKVEENNVWITIQTNPNIVAVSVLKEAGCVILADNSEPDENATAKANDEDIPVLSTEMSAYELAKKLGELGI